jgi:hypothetical protein
VAEQDPVSRGFGERSGALLKVANAGSIPASHH